MSNIAVFGLGSMGYGIAQSVLLAGHSTWGFDVVAAQVERFKSIGGQSGTAIGVVPNLDIAVIVVLNAEQTEDVLFGDAGIVRSMKAGATVISCATVPPDFARDMAARAVAHGIHYLDAPISGGSVKAAQGALSVMASGTTEAFSGARPALEAMAETVFELGDTPGTGSAMKSVNQLLAGVHIATMAEAMTFGISQGVTPEQFVDVISKCAGTSWMLENRAPHIVAGDYTPHSAVNIWLKDLGIVQDIAGKAGCATPITETALAQFNEAAEAGLGREDDAAVVKVYAKKAGISLPGDD